jgi:hypothetical protein
VVLTDIINLNRFKKAKARGAAESLATENRVRFGRSKTEKANDRREQDRRDKLLAGKELAVKEDAGDGK